MHESKTSQSKLPLPQRWFISNLKSSFQEVKEVKNVQLLMYNGQQTMDDDEQGLIAIGHELLCEQ